MIAEVKGRKGRSTRSGKVKERRRGWNWDGRRMDREEFGVVKEMRIEEWKRWLQEVGGWVEGRDKGTILTHKHFVLLNTTLHPLSE